MDLLTGEVKAKICGNFTLLVSRVTISSDNRTIMSVDVDMNIIRYGLRACMASLVIQGTLNHIVRLQ